MSAHEQVRLRRRTALLGAVIFLVPFALFLALARSASELHLRSETFTRLQGALEINLRLLDEDRGQLHPFRLGLGPSERVFITRNRHDVPFTGEMGTMEYQTPGGEWALAAYRRLPNQAYLVAQVNRDDLRAEMDQLRSTILLYVTPFLILGVLLTAIAWNYAMNSIERLTGELYQALRVAQQRERERDLAHKELAQRFEQERELARQKGQFQAQLSEYEKYAALAQLALGAAHEINNPLLGILSHLELELRAAPNSEFRRETEQCIEGAKRIAFTVRSLLNYARPGPLQLTRVNLERLLGDTLAFLEHQPLFRGIRLESHVDPDAQVITADANQVSQIITNLLLNAAEATTQGGSITVSVDKVKYEDKVVIHVADTGAGIPADILPHIFEPFFTTKRGKGTGLGLSITQAYLRSHGGDIQVESIPGRGTTFEVILPVRQVNQPTAEIEEVIV